MDLVSGVGRVEASSVCVEALEPQLWTCMLTIIFVFGKALGAILERFGSDFGRFREANKMEAKIDFREVFFRCFFRSRSWHGFWVAFWRVEP